MVKPQQEELRRSDLGATSQDSRKADAGGDRSRGTGTSGGDAGRPVPKGQVSPYGPAGEPVAEDDSDR
ncbi:hypothetical protein [Micromonospora sp. WMMD998]|uniref:hypothetical protein n=1 Tax=Micromonospora sp. WMMD998 TaxID=3016092 RepID=UPI00249C5ED3|nr:hypothetical protein [Micromonospora sp. WMMD998]WFE40413.1 hypothetical protein O7619_18990 [Micromonospora sp. WMMD998]